MLRYQHKIKLNSNLEMNDFCLKHDILPPKTFSLKMFSFPLQVMY